MFPNEDQLPTERGKLYELICEAKVQGLSFRYINVLRHRLMDSIAKDMAEGR